MGFGSTNKSLSRKDNLEGKSISKEIKDFIHVIVFELFLIYTCYMG